MKKVQIISSVINGNLKRNRNMIRDAIKSFEGKEIELIIQRKRKTRSNPQNNYFWGVVVPLVQNGLHDATGEVRDAQSVYRNILLPLFSPTRDITNRDTGEVLSEKITTSEMTTVEFMSFIEDIQKWSAEFLGVDIPDPNEDLQLEFK